MHLQLVQTTTPDGLRLWGALTQSALTPADRLVICLHGVASNFYASTLMQSLSTALEQKGLDVLRVNTRGHDNICTIGSDDGARRLGAAFEIVDDCRHDIAGWVKLASSRGYQDVILLGHSLGALKVIYSQAHEPLDQVSAIVAISPPRLSCQAFMEAETSSLFLESLERARQRVDQGQDDELIEIRFPLPLQISARGYLDKYGPGERYNLLEFISQIRSPLLVTFGSLEVERGSIAFAGLPEAIQHAVAANPDWPGTIDVVQGADHHYSDRRDELADMLTQWLARKD